MKITHKLAQNIVDKTMNILGKILILWMKME
jgi:sugar diacid utilization regulator